MKHAWLRDDAGELIVTEEDWPFYVTCGPCGKIEDVQYKDLDTVIEPDVDGCAGVSLHVTVTVSISHPGKATDHRDRARINTEIVIPMAQLLAAAGAAPEPVGRAVAQAAGRAVRQWRDTHLGHHADWAAALMG